MSLAGNSSGSYSLDAGVPFVGQFGAITGWMYDKSATNLCVACVSQNTNANAVIDLFCTAGNIRARISDDAAAASFAGIITSGVTQQGWTFGAASFSTTSARDIFGGGADVGGLIATASNATAATTAAWDRFSIGARRIQTTITTLMTTTMRIASVSFWNRPLTGQESRALRSGRHPFDVAQDALVYTFPLKSNARCEKTGIEMTLNGNAMPFFANQNPPVNDRRSKNKVNIRVPVAAGGFNPAWARNANILTRTNA